MFRRVHFDGSIRAMGELWWACDQISLRVWIVCAPDMKERGRTLAHELEDCGGNLFTFGKLEGRRIRPTANVSVCSGEVPAPSLSNLAAEEAFFQHVSELPDHERAAVLDEFEIDERQARLAEEYGLYDIIESRPPARPPPPSSSTRSCSMHPPETAWPEGRLRKRSKRAS